MSVNLIEADHIWIPLKPCVNAVLLAELLLASVDVFTLSSGNNLC